MQSAQPYIRHGFGTVRPYIYANLDVVEWVKRTFNAVELERHETGQNAYHIELRLDDSVLVIETGDFDEAAPRVSVYVYVDAVDQVYQRAIEQGAFSLSVPMVKVYNERLAGVRDTFGNTWYIATYKESL